MLLHEHLFSNTRKITFGHIKIDWPHETLTGPGFCGHLRSYLWDFSGPVPTFPLARKIRTDASAKSLTTIRKRGCETLREVQGDRWSNQIFNFIQEQFTDPLNEVGVQRVPWAAGLKVHVENGHYTCQQKNSSFFTLLFIRNKYTGREKVPAIQIKFEISNEPVILFLLLLYNLS